MSSAIQLNKGNGFLVVKIDMNPIEAAYNAVMSGVQEISNIEQTLNDYVKGVVNAEIAALGITDQNV